MSLMLLDPRGSRSASGSAASAAQTTSRQPTLKPQPKAYAKGVNVIVTNGDHQGKHGRLDDRNGHDGWWLDLGLPLGQVPVFEQEIGFDPRVYKLD